MCRRIDIENFICYNNLITITFGKDAPMRSYMSFLYGNRAAKEQLGHAAEKDALSHALIIEGPQGSGKKTFARQIIASALCEERHKEGVPLPCGCCRACRLVLEGKAADVRWISRADKATLSVDTVRAEKNDMYLAPNEFEHKFYVFEDAHTMTLQAQNALLIALEEPPRNVHILLLCESADALLTTVRSRARLVKMQKFTKEEVGAWLEENSPLSVQAFANTPEKLDALLTEADGCIGRALLLTDVQNAEEVFKERELTELTLSSLSSHSFTKLSSAFSIYPTKRDELILALNSLLRALRDLVLLKRDANAPLTYFSDAQLIPQAFLSLKMTTLLRSMEGVEQAMRKLERNANSATVLNVLKYTLRKG